MLDLVPLHIKYTLAILSIIIVLAYISTYSQFYGTVTRKELGNIACSVKIHYFPI